MSSIVTQPAIAARSTLKWRIYLMEAALLGFFMVSACGFGVLLFHPRSFVMSLIPGEFVRLVLMGLTMGATAVVLIYSRWGKGSGAHMNPAFTLCNLRLGRITPTDAMGYILGQFGGATLGVGLMAIALPGWLDDPGVNYVVTVPGRAGLFVAWLGEFIIAFVLMLMVQLVNRKANLAPYTGWFAGLLLVVYITFESPLSGMSLNPARTFGSAIVAQVWTAMWIYFTAPVAGMFAAIELLRLTSPRKHAMCCKLSHCPRVPCEIRCDCVTHLNEHASA